MRPWFSVHYSEVRAHKEKHWAELEILLTFSLKFWHLGFCCARKRKNGRRRKKKKTRVLASEDVSRSASKAGQGGGVQPTEGASGQDGRFRRRAPSHALRPPLSHPGEGGTQARALMRLLLFVPPPCLIQVIFFN